MFEENPVSVVPADGEVQRNRPHDHRGLQRLQGFLGRAGGDHVVPQGVPNSSNWSTIMRSLLCEERLSPEALVEDLL